MWACLGSTCLGPSVFPISCYQYPLDLENFSARISSNVFSVCFSFSSPSRIRIMHKFACFILSHRSHISFIFFHLLFCLLSWLGDFHYSLFHITNSFLCIIHSGLYCLSFSLYLCKWIFYFSWLLLICSHSFLRESAFLFQSSLNSFRIFTLSLLNSKSVRLQRSVSLLTALGEFSCCFNWEFISEVLHLACVFLFVWISGSQTVFL